MIELQGLQKILDRALVVPTLEAIGAEFFAPVI